MKNYWKKHRIIFCISIFLLLVLPLFYWLSLFAVRKIKDKADLIQEKIIDGNLEKLKLEKIVKMEEANAEFEKNKDAVGTILDSDSKVDFIEDIESLALETNNKIEIKVLSDEKDNQPGKGAVKTGAKKDDGEKTIEERLAYKQYISMQIDLVGDYQSFLDFERKLENNKYYVNIISLDLQKVFIKKEKTAEGSPVFSEGMFLSSEIQGNNLKSNLDSDGDLVLKSSLNIIVYTQ